jgi:hypothetical protein
VSNFHSEELTMNSTDFKAQIRDCVDGGARPVTTDEITRRAATHAQPARRVPVRRVPVRLAVTVTGVAAGVAAAGVAGALVASQGGGTSGTGGTSAVGRVSATGTVLTAAMVKHVVSTSQAAMTSGEADLDWTSSGLPAVIQQITFNGADWNDVIDPGAPSVITHTGKTITVIDPGSPVSHTGSMISRSGESINRVVDGRTYIWPAPRMTSSGVKFEGWELLPGASTGSGIPDPRTLLGLLSPSAGFVTAGDTTVNGVTVQQLRATTPGAVAITPLNQIIDSEPDHAQLSAIDLWVDPAGVVQKIQVTVSGTDGKGNPQSATVTAVFSKIGQAQPITAPATYTTPGTPKH